MSTFGQIIRAVAVRPERTWRIPAGLSRGIKVKADKAASLHKYIGTGERETVKYLEEFARPGAICFDVGCHDAQLAMSLARLTKADVWCFEHDPICIARMATNMSLNPAVAKFLHVIQTYVAHESVEHPRADSLDDLIADHRIPIPYFIKIDVEGAEQSVLRGATELLGNHKPHILLETHTRELSVVCAAQLVSLGYDPVIKVSQRSRFRENRDPVNGWLVAQGKPSQQRALGRSSSRATIHG